mmetsp:Transcript_10613/g.15788  ORF Transcript_10613/g.15788 Transcript_10613/m.15788 type:complete len:84 (+) Transcript_10613:30-281(+)
MIVYLCRNFIRKSFVTYMTNLKKRFSSATFMVEARTITSQLEQSANASNMTAVRSFCSVGNGFVEYGTVLCPQGELADRAFHH